MIWLMANGEWLIHGAVAICSMNDVRQLLRLLQPMTRSAVDAGAALVLWWCWAGVDGCCCCCSAMIEAAARARGLYRALTLTAPHSALDPSSIDPPLCACVSHPQISRFHVTAVLFAVLWSHIRCDLRTMVLWWSYFAVASLYILLSLCRSPHPHRHYAYSSSPLCSLSLSLSLTCATVSILYSTR